MNSGRFTFPPLVNLTGGGFFHNVETKLLLKISRNRMIKDGGVK